MKVSIIIANYNYGSYLGRALRSACSQRFLEGNYEIIVVDDGSTDNSRVLLQSYPKDIRSFYNKTNQGLAYSRNKGIEVSRGDYVVFLDSDDYITRDMIYIQAKFLDVNESWDAVSSDYYLVNEDEDIIGRKDAQQEPIACGVMYRRETLMESGLFDIGFRMHEDKELRHRYEKNYRVENIQLPMYRYRQHESNMLAVKSIPALEMIISFA